MQTTDISSEEIGEMLNPAGKNEVLLTIGNLANPAKQVLVKKECKKGNAITEEQLATAFSMYSLETTSEREFVCPFKTTVTADPVDLGKFKTFAFSAIDENNSKLETAINESIKKITGGKLVFSVQDTNKLVSLFQTSSYGLIIGREFHLCHPFFSAAYKGFITNTMKYRDPKTQFTDANGFKRCMFWDTFKYSQVADAIQKPGNKTTYSYLYYYAPYINPSGNNAV